MTEQRMEHSRVGAAGDLRGKSPESAAQEGPLMAALKDDANRALYAAQRRVDALGYIGSFVGTIRGLGLDVVVTNGASGTDTVGIVITMGGAGSGLADVTVRHEGPSPEVLIQDALMRVVPSARLRALDPENVEPHGAQNHPLPDEAEPDTPPESEEAPVAGADAAPPPVADTVGDDDLADADAPGFNPRRQRGRRADGTIAGVWTEAEEDHLVERVLDGAKDAEIAAELGRVGNAVYQRRHKLADVIEAARRSMDQEDGAETHEQSGEDPDEGQAEGQNGGEAAQEPPAPAPKPMPDQSELTVTERRVNQRLDQLGYPVPWTPALDLALMRCIVAEGFGFDKTAVRLGVMISEARSRWEALLPEPGVDQQKQLAAVLRWRASHLGDDGCPRGLVAE